MIKPKILLLTKIPPLDFHCNGESEDSSLHERKAIQDANNAIIERVLKKHGVEYDNVTRKEIAGWMVQKYDFIFSAGGDGTAIAAAYFNFDRPQLNLRNDPKSRGALCQNNLEEAIERTLAGDYKIEEWNRQNVFLNCEFVGRALNEVIVFDGNDFGNGVKYDIEVHSGNEILNERQENSGLIVCTGTGSTGWPAAFKPYKRTDSQFEFAVLMPMVGSSHGKGEYIKITYKNYKGGFKLDGADELRYPFPRNSVLEIRPSESPLKVIIPSSGEK